MYWSVVCSWGRVFQDVASWGDLVGHYSGNDTANALTIKERTSRTTLDVQFLIFSMFIFWWTVTYPLWVVFLIMIALVAFALL